MIKFLEYRKWIRLFNEYRFSNWETSDNNSIMFTVEDDAYIVLDVNNGEVYVEQFNTIDDLEQFYETKVNYVPGLQVTIFDY
ncbi:hypothetical protein [Macrococcoides canis]|uniref:hypothetical protein n=1 Tax=Macrococcoides canis TaxID=1855823 RepID=UPI0020B80809|nr:hypothetical protein [Macrococcus canis]UTH10927.1 hypothetical protein KFV10_08395 [Macrococcus canis]